MDKKKDLPTLKQVEAKEKGATTDFWQGAEPPSLPYPKYEPRQDTLIAFESGHYKAFRGVWKGDSVWAHFKTSEGKTIHVNKDKVEYIQTEEI